jgi:predicted nucleic-acid-binding Zn-ribbon protein
MAIYSYNSPKWKPLGMKQKVTDKCPRCGNTVDFQLVYDDEGLSALGKVIVRTNRVYALHCPICVYVGQINKGTAKSLEAKGC